MKKRFQLRSRVICLCLFAAILFTTLLYTLASTAELPEFYVNDVNGAKPGENVKIELGVSGLSADKAIDTFGVTLTYPEGFTYVSANATSKVTNVCRLTVDDVTENTYCIEHDSANRTVTLVAAVNTVELAAGGIAEDGILLEANFTAPATISNEGYTFTATALESGFVDLAGEISEVTTKDGTVTLTEDVKYTVTFTDGATFSDKSSGDKITVPEYTGTVPSGKVFVGWKNKASDEVLTVGSEYTVAGNAEFEASWRDGEIETDETTVPSEIVITVEKKPDAPSEDKITAIENKLGNLLTVKEAALSFEITAEKNSVAITDLEGNVSFKIYFNTIANYSADKTYRLFHFNSDGTFKEECALTKNADHFAFTVNTLSPFVLAEVGAADNVVEYIPVATYDKTAGTVSVSLSVSGAKLGMGSFGFKYDTSALTNPIISYKSDVAKSASDFITDGAVSTADAVRDTWIGWNGATVSAIDATSAAVEFATITFTTTAAFTESDFRANPTAYFYVDTPTDTLNDAIYYDGSWRVDIWEDSLVVPTGEYPTVALDLTVTAPTTVTVRGSFKKEGTSIITVSGDPGYSSLAVVKLYANGSTTPYKTATTNEAADSGNTVIFEFTDVELGEYYFTIEKNGYIKYTSSVINVTEETDITGTAVMLIPGDIKGSMSDTVGDGVVDVYDFIRIIRGLDSLAGDMLKGAVDITEDGHITIDDLGCVKTYYKKTASDYAN